MATINGTAVNFGFQGTNGVTISGLSGTLLQSAEISNNADKEETRGGTGDIVTRGWYDQHQQAQLEWVVTGSSLANAITNSAIAAITPGSFVSISACTSMPELVANWEVQASPKVSGTNTTSKKITITIEKRAGITGTVTA